MRVRIYKEPEGRQTIIVERTHRDEGKTVVYTAVEPDRVQSVLAEGVKSVSRETQLTFPESSLAST